MIGALIIAALLFTALVAVSARAADPDHDKVVGTTPPATTPAVQNGFVDDIVQVGGTTIAGGTFTTVAAPGGSDVTRRYLFAFNASTGALSSSFTPALDKYVRAVIPGPTAGTVYVAGAFTTVNGATNSRVALLDVSTGQRVASFKPPTINGVVQTIATAGSRLIIGGNFTKVGGVAHGGLAALNATTGAADHSYLNITLAGHHNDSGSGAVGAIGPKEMEATGTGDRLVVVGNFTTANGLPRDQAVMVNLGSSSAQVASWRTRGYEPLCFNWAFDSYMRGISVAPDDSYFVITATGGPNPGTLCDTATRWDFDDTGDDVQPVWIDDTGGDTLWAVEVTETAVYVGGHMRWMNNSNGRDFAGAGAVPRPGIAALSTTTGLPLAWNPGRHPRGVAVYALYASPTGLWEGSDTQWLGNRKWRRPRIGFFPLAGGNQETSDVQESLPGDVYLAGSRNVDQGNVLYRVDTGGPVVAATDGGPDWVADDQTDSPYRNSGSSVAGYSPSASRDGSLPGHVPTAVFDSERWSPSDDPRMSWDFPATSGMPLQVRLFFANRYSGTSNPGSRVFDVSVDGTQVLDNFDIAAAVGDQRGMMRSFDITSDGLVDIDFGHVVENPLINAIEIVRRDRPAPVPQGENGLSTIEFDGSTAGSETTVNNLGVAWGQLRGAFQLANGTMFYGKSDGALYRRSFNGSAVGTEAKIDPYNDPIWANVGTGSGSSTYRGALPAFYGQIPSVSGMFYDAGRIYYTLTGNSALFWRDFNVDSGIVGNIQNVASGPVNWSQTAGLLLDGGTLYFVDSGSGALKSIAFSAGTPTGTVSTVDTTNDWRARALFVGP